MTNLNSSSVGVGCGNRVVLTHRMTHSISDERSCAVITRNGAPENGGDAEIPKLTSSLHRLLGPADDRARPAVRHAQLQGATDASQGGRNCSAPLPPSPGACSPQGAFLNTQIPARFRHVPGAGSDPSPVPSAKAAGWGRLLNVARRLDDHWVGDLIGVISLFGAVYLLLVLAWVAS